MRFAKNIQKVLGTSKLLKMVEQWLCYREPNLLPPPIFLVGSPRSGSTLIYQTLVTKYDLAYLSNFHSLFYAQPCLAEYLVRVAKFIGIGYRPVLTSDYGFVKGLLAPSEAGPTFRYWFGESDFELGTHVTDCESIRQGIATITNYGAKPFVAKNLFNSMRLHEIIRCFPDSFFVWIRRDRKEVIASILAMRRHLYKDPSQWASVKIPGWREMESLSPEEQVRQQVEMIEEYVSLFLNGLPFEQSIKIDFGMFRRKVEEETDKIISSYTAFSGHRVSLNPSFSKDLFEQVRP